MEPASMIVGALVAGASAALKDTASQAVQDSYQGLKTLVIRYWKSRTELDAQANEIEAKVFLNNLESDLTGFQKPLEKKLNEIMPEPEPEIIQQAQQLRKLLEEAEQSPGKYRVYMGDNSQGVQIGNKNKQNNTFSK